MEIKLDKSEWKKVRLGDVAFEYSKRIKNPSESDFERFVGSSNIAQWDFRVKTWKSTDSVTSAMKLFEANDYLLVRRSLYASDFRERAPRAHFDGVCSGDILTIKENPEFIADGFLIGVLNCPALWKYVVANASGSITRRIKWKDLANYEFLLPPKEQQAELAQLLWSMEKVIEKELTVLEQLKIIKATNLKKLSQNKDGALSKIEDFVEIKNGFAFSGKSFSEEETKYIVMTPGNFKIGGGFLNNKFKYLTEIDIGEKLIFEVGDIVLTMTDLSKEGDTLGYPAKIPKIEGKKILHNQRIGKVVFVNSNINKDFLYYIFQTPTYRSHILNAATRTTVRHTYPDRIKSFKFFKPNSEIENNWVSKFKMNGKVLCETELKINSSRSLQRSLINQVF